MFTLREASDTVLHMIIIPIPSRAACAPSAVPWCAADALWCDETSGQPGPGTPVNRCHTLSAVSVRTYEPVAAEQRWAQQCYLEVAANVS